MSTVGIRAAGYSARSNNNSRARSHREGRHAGSESRTEWIVAMAVALLLVLATVIGASAPRSTPTEMRSVHVEAGQTLWSIAKANALPGLTTEQTAQLIARANGLTRFSLAEHTSLKVPVAQASHLLASR